MTVQLSKVRLPDELHAKLVALTCARGGTLSGHISAKLTAAFDAEQTVELIARGIEQYERRKSNIFPAIISDYAPGAPSIFPPLSYGG